MRARLGDVEGRAPPDRNDEYMLYQMLVGAWPADMLDAPSTEALEAFGERLRGALEKSLREAKRRSSWAAPNAEYEEAMQRFAREALRPEGGGFLSSFLPFVQRVARLGVENSLSQTVLKLTAPGVPDIYQGCELWDLSLVDPGQPARGGLRGRGRARCEAMSKRLSSERERLALFETLLDSWRDGRIKLALTAALLALRREHEELFENGDYQPLTVTGAQADWVVGFSRTFGESKVAVIVARFPAHREATPEWEAAVELPAGDWRDAFGRTPYESGKPLARLARQAPRGRIDRVANGGRQPTAVAPGSPLLPPELVEGAGVRENFVFPRGGRRPDEGSAQLGRSFAKAGTPHPNPLPQGERGLRRFGVPKPLPLCP